MGGVEESQPEPASRARDREGRAVSGRSRGVHTLLEFRLYSVILYLQEPGDCCPQPGD